MRLPFSLRSVALFVVLFASLARAQGNGKLQIFFFDVGQGDGSLIITPSGKTILVDAGPPDAGPHVASRLKQLVHGKLDLAVLSHPHADHLGGMLDALQAVGTKRFLDPGFDHPSKGYRDLLEWVGSNVGQVMNPIPDPAHPQELVTIGLGDGITMNVLWPRKPVEPFLEGTRSDPNSNSVVFKLVYGKTAFMFVGDAEPDTEDVLLQKNIDFTSTLLKVGHHGGRHSSTEPWLARIKPKIAMIQVAEHNDYGHPGAATLDRLHAIGAEIFRNDQDGEVHVQSDGSQVTVTTEKGHSGPFTVKGETRAQVATGPILPSERHLSEATLEDQKRYGGRDKGKADDNVALPNMQRTAAKFDLGGGSAPVVKNDGKGEVKSAVVVEEKKETPKADPDALIPDAVKERYAVPVKGTDRQVKYVASRNSNVFHMADCEGVHQIKAKNRIEFWSRSEAAKGRKPAEDCNP